jgi:hypothetical protein
MRNGWCRFHGGRSTGPHTAEGLQPSKRARWKHGHYSQETKAENARTRAAVLLVRWSALECGTQDELADWFADASRSGAI